MEMENPVFMDDLDVSKGSDYVGFVSRVRNKLVLDGGATRQLELVLLRTQEEDPRKAPWFGVTLRCGCDSGEEQVLLRIRADNLYISGYQCPAGRWWEFKGDPVVPSATQLAFTDNYNDMKRVAGVGLDKVALGKAELEKAVRQLAATTGGSGQKETARSLMVTALMVSEAVRFRSVAGVLGHVMLKRAAAHALPAHMVEQVRNWSSLSEYWLGAVRFSEPFLPRIAADEEELQQHDQHVPRHLLAPLKIECQDHAMAALGVALNRLRPLQDRHKEELDNYWRSVRARACELDRARR